MNLREPSLLDAQGKECEPDEDFIQGLLLRVRVENEFNSLESWVDCPRCSCQMWRGSALCEVCDLN